MNITKRIKSVKFDTPNADLRSYFKFIFLRRSSNRCLGVSDRNNFSEPDLSRV